MPKRSRSEMSQYARVYATQSSVPAESSKSSGTPRPLKVKLPWKLVALSVKSAGEVEEIHGLLSKKSKRQFALLVPESVAPEALVKTLAAIGELQECGEALSQYVGMRCIVFKLAAAKDAAALWSSPQSKMASGKPSSSAAAQGLSSSYSSSSSSSSGMIQAWINRRDFRSDEAGLQLEVDEEVSKYEAREAEVEASLDAISGAADDRGFRTVARADEGRLVESDRARKKRRKAASGAGGDDSTLYKFKRREQQLRQLSEVRSRFKADKAKVQRMKNARHFKPF